LTNYDTFAKLGPIMKKLVFFSTIVLLFAVSFPVLAETDWPKAKKNVVLSSDEVVNRDYFAAGESVTISGIVNGDVFVGAGSVFVDGKINGDLIAGAGTVTLTGEVTQDVRVGAGTVSIQGVVGQNVTVAGGNINITKDALIGGSVLAMGGNIETLGIVEKDVQVYGGKVLLGGNIGRDVRGEMGKLAIAPKTQILGDLIYGSSKEVAIPEEATVSGKIDYTPTEEKAKLFLKKPAVGSLLRQLPKKPFSRAKTTFKLTSFLFALVLGFIFIKISPKGVMGIAQVLETRPWISLGVGLLTPILFVIAMILLMITIIGIPFALLLMVLFGFLVCFSKIFTAFFLGRKLLLSFNMDERRGWALFAGLLLYYLLKLVPFVKFFSGLTFTLFGLGAFVLYQKSLRHSVKAGRERTSNK